MSVNRTVEITKEKSPGKRIRRANLKSLLCLSQPSAPFLGTCGSKFSEHSHFRCWFKRSPSPTPQKSVSLGQGPRICLWQASPGDSNTGELDCWETPRKDQLFLLRAHDTDLKRPAFHYKHEASRRWSPQARNPFSPHALSRPATREISLQDVIDTESRSDLVITSGYLTKKLNSVFILLRGFRHILFCRPLVCSFWGPASICINPCKTSRLISVL